MDAELAGMWVDGLVSGDIARHFRTTRNAVIGRVHRLHLPARPSPIPGHVPAKRDILPEKRDIGVTTPVVVAPPPPPPPPIPVRAPVWGCAWLDGERPTWRRCDAPVWRHSSWCRVHHAIAYQRRAA